MATITVTDLGYSVNAAAREFQIDVLVEAKSVNTLGTKMVVHYLVEHAIVKALGVEMVRHYLAVGIASEIPGRPRERKC